MLRMRRGAAAELLASAGPLLGRSGALPPGLLETSRLRDANAAEPSKAVVQSLEWHPDGQVLLTAGLDKRLRFFQARGCFAPEVFFSLFICSAVGSNHLSPPLPTVHKGSCACTQKLLRGMHAGVCM